MNNKAYQKMDYALCLLSAAADGAVVINGQVFPGKAAGDGD